MSADHPDAAERNIMYLQELKSVIITKIELLKLKLLDNEPKEYSDINLEYESKTLINQTIKNTNFDSTMFHIGIKIFFNEHIVNNEDTEIQELKQNLYQMMQEFNKIAKDIQILYKQLQTLENKNNELKEEISSLTSKHEHDLDDIIQANEQSESESFIAQKDIIKSRVEKINLMMMIIKRLIHYAQIESWSDNPELQEIFNQCRYEYKLK